MSSALIVRNGCYTRRLVCEDHFNAILNTGNQLKFSFNVPPIYKQRYEQCTHSRLVKSAFVDNVASKSVETRATSSTVTVLWFKTDLRLDDNPGAVSALESASVIPVFVFDPLILSEMQPSLLPLLIDAVHGLRNELQALGSDLVVSVGATGEVLPALLQKSGASHVVTQAETDSTWRSLIAQLSSSTKVSTKTWHTSLYDSYTDPASVPEDYRSYQKGRGALSPPLDPPKTFPPLPPGIEPGSIPSLEELRLVLPGPLQLSGPEETVYPSWPNKRAMAALGNGASSNSLYMYRGYLRFLEPSTDSTWQSLYFYLLEDTPPAAFPSFLTLFTPALTLGTLSVRRVLHEALGYNMARAGGIEPLFGFTSFTIKQAVIAAQMHQYHADLALSALSKGGQRGFQKLQYWRWRGFLLEYTVSGAQGPPVLLVHGFGAFWDHFRGNVAAMAEEGHRVWALTLPGFGRSQKPLLRFTQYTWSACVAEFIACIVKEPVSLVGNSIGGYTAASVAADWPHLVNSLVLLNSAGRVDANFSEQKAIVGQPKVPEPLPYLLSRVLFFYLQTSAKKILQRCYPEVPSRADDALVLEILRASHDPGAPYVIESAFYLPPPRALNFLLHKFGGKVLVVQGKFDPLNDAVSRAALIEQSYSDTQVELVAAGHCPHDEIPLEVNSILIRFLADIGAET